MPSPHLDWVWHVVAGVIGLVGLGLLYRALLADRSRGRERCPKCWYDMAGWEQRGSLTCPECGRDAKSARRLGRTRRKKKLAAVAVVLLALVWPAAVWPGVAREGWAAAPMWLLLRVEPDAAEIWLSSPSSAPPSRPALNELITRARSGRGGASWVAAVRRAGSGMGYLPISPESRACADALLDTTMQDGQLTGTVLDLAHAIAERCGVPVSIDEKSIRHANERYTDAKLTIVSHGGPRSSGADALDEMCAGASWLGWTVHDGQVVVGGPDTTGRHRCIASIDVAKPLRAGWRAAAITHESSVGEAAWRAEALTSLLDIVASQSPPRSWAPYGRPGLCSSGGKSIILVHNAVMIVRAERMIEALVAGPLAGDPPVSFLAAHPDPTLDRLESTPAPVLPAGTPLREVLTAVADACGLRLLAGEHIDEIDPIRVNTLGFSCMQLLDLIDVQGEFDGGPFVMGEMIFQGAFFSSPPAASLSVKTYDLRRIHSSWLDRAGMPMSAEDFDGLLDIVTSTITPDEWEDNGGDSAIIRVFGPLMIVQHHALGHRRLQRILGSVADALQGRDTWCNDPRRTLGRLGSERAERPREIGTPSELVDWLPCLDLVEVLQGGVTAHDVMRPGATLDDFPMEAAITDWLAIPPRFSIDEFDAVEWTIVGGIAIIGTQYDVRGMEPTVRIFDADRIFAEPSNRPAIDRLEELIQQVDPDGWENNGGDTSFTRPLGPFLLVKTMPRTMVEIDAIVASLGRGELDEGDATPPTPATD